MTAVAICDPSMLGATTTTPSVTVTRTPTCTPAPCHPRTCPPGEWISCAECGCSCTCVPRATATPTCTPQPTPKPPFCAGDCDANATVTIAELVRGVGIALGAITVDACPQFVCSGPSCVIVDVVISAVYNALHGCPTIPRTTPTGERPTATPIPPATKAALERVIPDQCIWNCPAFFSRAVYGREDGYTVECACVTWHTTHAELIRHACSADASAAFLEATKDRGSLEFHGYPAAYWVVPNDTISPGGTDRYLVWQLACWVLTVHSFDDTHFQLAANPVAFSEAILGEAGNTLRTECAADQ